MAATARRLEAVEKENPQVVQHSVEPSASQPDTDASTPDETIRLLKSAIIDIDALSQTAFSEIRTVVRLVLTCFESADSPLSVETIAVALQIIADKAEETEDRISYQAEDVGCNYVDERSRRRWANYRAALDIREGK
ncbi:hypothetical protein [Halothiobacillus sp.]|uniref:hypothetical protein n=1 Tax=Halothiobacillus sp. TaxID=1891311 RepID=UPI002AD38DB5|nr:hypothetical protein [Halothiobacillus sp.]